MLGRLKIATRLFLVLGCVVLAMVLVAAYGMVSLTRAQASTAKGFCHETRNDVDDGNGDHSDQSAAGIRAKAR